MSSTDTTPADNNQLAGIIFALERMQQVAAENETTIHDMQQQGDPEWAGPSLPHPTEATSPEEADELDEQWGDWRHGIEPNTEEAAL